MAQTVRIDEPTHALLKQLAEDDKLSLNDELALAVKARRKEKFFADMQASYLAMTDAERAEEAKENAVWDTTLRDGREAE